MTSFTTLAATLSLTAATHQPIAPDTTIVVGRTTIQVKELRDETIVQIERTNQNGDTIRARSRVSEKQGREHSVILPRRIRIPFVYNTPTAKKKSINYDSSMLSFGYGKMLFDGASDKIDHVGSYRWTLEVISANVYTKYVDFRMGTAFDFNKIKLLDDYTYQRNEQGVTTLFAPQEGANYKKDRLSATYLNLFAQVRFKPISQVRKIWISGYAGIKLNTASSMKVWHRNGGKDSFDGNKNLKGYLPEIGAGIGYGPLGVHFRHIPTSIFAKDKGPALMISTITFSYGL